MNRRAEMITVNTCLLYTSVGEMTEIAALGVFIHGRAGDLATENKGMYGMKAGDLLLTIPEVLKYGGRHEEI